MNELDILRSKILKLKEETEIALKIAFNKNKRIVAYWNTYEQMYKKGQDSKGSIIRPAYKPITVKIKKRKGQPTDRVTLRDTGRFHKSLKVIADNKKVRFESDVNYYKYLEKKYGTHILGLQKEFLLKFMRTKFEPEYKSRVYNIINSK